ncbi:Rpp14/Pop5 family-domain-containing protein [Scheffersomyces coipomensis]|uniref:Rpp14/Pop5 family-domain-containing protein n=1 Tax=Scheffersomyces coipomensis TaxID=1788519 RepID=UPI00315D5899
MVRIKHRYILFEVLYPPSNPNHEEFVKFSETQEDALLTLHQASPSSINARLIISTIRKSIQEHYGEHGVGAAGLSINMKYWSNKTSTGIIRCDRESFQIVVGAITLINRFESNPVIIRCTHISGTIHKCEEYSIRRSKELIRLINNSALRTKGKQSSQFLLSLEESTSLKISDDDRIEIDG